MRIWFVPVLRKHIHILINSKDQTNVHYLVNAADKPDGYPVCSHPNGSLDEALQLGRERRSVGKLLPGIHSAAAAHLPQQNIHSHMPTSVRHRGSSLGQGTGCCSVALECDMCDCTHVFEMFHISTMVQL